MRIGFRHVGINFNEFISIPTGPICHQIQSGARNHRIGVPSLVEDHSISLTNQPRPGSFIFFYLLFFHFFLFFKFNILDVQRWKRFVSWWTAQSFPVSGATVQHLRTLAPPTRTPTGLFRRIHSRLSPPSWMWKMNFIDQTIGYVSWSDLSGWSVPSPVYGWLN